MPKDKNAKRLRKVRHIRLRNKVSGTPERPRLAVFRSLRHIYAQVIDDTTGHTLAAASSAEVIKDAGGPITPKIDASTAVGKMVAERAIAEGITQVVFDRGGCKFHGRVKALAEATREAGLKF
ncbi:MAG: 50S ribosomal protein L18 [Chloroflexi bacterium]|jgi:large subunit ribosomal protein L18|nr:50S ribosomal protein L18 [Dehalococcoidia bacterium]PKB81921.1 MAG: 50S ribosomal protein L18 [SAR202 cluster bacterium MP-SInd-SRR3963457-G1]PKB85313.1 MAG: 50S ribosomal protein L18 [SAR202 cluster bacterium MP-NPac-SRR3961935-G1]RUA22081.1 MAG: 50S ribosomal protein L18 [Chloroflexota bacterium]PCJ79343.1 MAG: 50S ribosomal protein L18 [Dehalococcoidia bacterium]|tara:strand:+ start:1971 stop:2339 length:369 start_codon:yes stop_codon:yes gene_type:complete